MADIIGGLVSLGVGILWYVFSISLGSDNLGGGLGLGPDFFPRLLAYIMIFLGIISTGKAIYLKKKQVEGSQVQIKKITIYMIITFVLYLLAVNILGYVVSSFIYLVVSIAMLGEKRSIKDLIPAALVVICLYGVFHMILSVPLPRGLLI